MQVVAATRLRRAQAAVQATRPYADKMLEVLQTVSERATEYKHPFLIRREGKRAVMILVTTDKGLAGAVNVNNIRTGTRYMSQHYPDQQRYVTLGRKGRDFLLRYRRDVIAEVSNLPDRPSQGQVLPAVTVALEEYTKGNVDAVLLCYAKWVSTLKQEPTVRVLIPAEIPARERAASGPRADYIYEPDPESVLDGLLPRYVETQVFQAVLENKASEYSAKMIAMQNATNAAGDLIDSLTLYANKVRQAGITTELMEIVSGAAAQEGSNCGRRSRWQRRNRSPSPGATARQGVRATSARSSAPWSTSSSSRVTNPSCSKHWRSRLRTAERSCSRSNPTEATTRFAASRWTRPTVSAAVIPSLPRARRSPSRSGSRHWAGCSTSWAKRSTTSPRRKGRRAGRSIVPLHRSRSSRPRSRSSKPGSRSST